MFEAAEVALEKKLGEEKYKERNIGWFKIDIEKTPELAMDDSGKINQMVVARGMSRMIHFGKISDELEDNVSVITTILQELTGDWVLPIACEEIQNQKRWYYDEIVYFGPKEDLEKDGIADIFNTASMIDRYNFDEQRVGFYYNDDPECRELRSLEKDEKYYVFYNGENSVPFILQVGLDKIDLPRLMFETTAGVVKGTPRWGQRANAAIFNHFSNGLIYMMPESIEPEKMMEDWRIMLMVRMIELM